jgi:hypothetical protein
VVGGLEGHLGLYSGADSIYRKISLCPKRPFFTVHEGHRETMDRREGKGLMPFS